MIRTLDRRNFIVVTTTDIFSDFVSSTSSQSAIELDLPTAEESLQRGLDNLLAGNIRPIEELWEGLDVE
jgi:hypothetical protein